MISTRPLYNSNLEFFRRSDRGDHMPLSQIHHIQDYHEGPGHLSNRTTPSSEPDNRSTGGQRKRVPVACERCRKRKIKCSGNEGDNQSCANCKNAGHGDSCRFLRVSSADVGTFGPRGWHSPLRYSPYSVPSTHRHSYVPSSSRYTSQNSVTYPTVHSNIDFAPYGATTPTADWTKAPYVGTYSPYPDDEETSPYTSYPPPYILPNTDPMSSASSYYVHTQNVRPHPGTLWSEQQSCLSQQNSSLSNPTFTVIPETQQSYAATAGFGNLPSDRILPTPFSARGTSSTHASSLDSVPNSASTQRSSMYWSPDSVASTQHIPSQVDSDADQEQLDDRRNASYSLNDMSYSHVALGDSLSTGILPVGLSLPADAPHTPPTVTSAEGLQAHQSLVQRSRESPKSHLDNTPATYGYTALMTGRSSQMRSTSTQLSNGSVYCHSHPLLTRREALLDGCNPADSSGCPVNPTRNPTTGISNVTSGY
ncbi:hypothetical protein PV08_03448 [Exophiala spinifera]|uniref:Zn(2)-C6 fungal-type domain-containing protein n=1 Tax=Exophiala spinifera TaxID=91928 RepID=A0A0D2BKP3_9EURO|nr:uncharacterized protein PV08_03448 [Exophiala spinifera]KIW19155.1 hypothetical protein PV08_03448 [Exophiala spinifera]